jgi:demethylphylloquinone reductase
MTTPKQPARICILGGGFGGLYTALRLSQFPFAKHETPEITLVDQRDRFLFSPLLYELLTGELETWEISPPYSDLLANTNIRFIQGEVANINLEDKKVKLDNDNTLNYDYLVLSMGGKTPLNGVEGAEKHAIAFRDIPDAYQLEEKLRLLEASPAEKIRLAIVGGGYSGVELACKLRDRVGEKARIRIIEKSNMILQNSSEFNRDTAKKALEKRDIWMDLETSVQSVTENTISLLYKGQLDTLPVDIVLWTVGNQVSPLVENLDFAKNKRGQIITNSTLQVREYPEIFALGDLAECQDAEGKQVPATAQVAIQQADYTAWNIWASLTGRPLLQFRYFSLGEMMTLGTDNATLTGLGIELDGPLAHLVRRLAYLYRLPTLEHQIKVAFNWITRPFQEMLLSK